MLKQSALYGALLLICQVLVGCDATPIPKTTEQAGEAPGAARGAQSEPNRLLVAFGDSLYAGYGLEPKAGFAPILQQRLRDRGYAVSVLNAGVSGDTTAAGRARLSFVLDNAPQKVEMVILGLGGNDMLRGIAPMETRANLSAMLSELRKRDIDVVMTGMLAAPNLGADYAAKFNAVYPDLARQYDAPLYPFFLEGVVTRRDMMLPDGIHPNAQGISEIAGRVAPTVAAALDEE